LRERVKWRGAPKAFVPYCRECGKQVPEGARFCPSCGAPQAVEAKPSATEGRTIGLSLISVYLIIGCVAGVVAGVTLVAAGLSLRYLIGASLARAAAFGVEWLLDLLPGLGLTFLGLAVMEGVAAYGLWAVRHWGWTMAVTVLAAGIIANVPMSASPLALVGVIGIILNFACLAYLSKSEVRKLFEPTKQLA
jgi:hypothetical protein